MNIVEALLKVALLGSEWILYLLIGLSVVSFAAMFERLWYFQRQAGADQALRRKLTAALRSEGLDGVQRVLAQSPSIAARVLRFAFEFHRGGADAVSDAIESELGRARPELERGLNLLGTLGNNAPFIGLFGTVIGVIQAFHQLGEHGNKAAAMGSVMSGIAEALVATGVGIFVAIPAVVAYNTIQKRVNDLEGLVGSLGKLLTAHLKAQRTTRIELSAIDDLPDLSQAGEHTVTLQTVEQ